MRIVRRISIIFATGTVGFSDLMDGASNKNVFHSVNTLSISCGHILRAIHCEDWIRQKIEINSKEVTVAGTITGI